MHDVPPQLAAIARRQDGVVTTAQVVAAGASTTWAARRVSSGRWQRLYRGVLVVHSGPVPWRSRARAALLHAGDGAALSHTSAAFRLEMTAREPSVITVSIPAERRLARAPGLRVVRRRPMPAAWGGLRTVNRADTALDLVATARTADDVVGWLSAAVRAGTRPEEIRAAAALRSRLPHRSLLADVVADVVDGIESPLERRYRHDVEIAHGLPRAVLQQRESIDGVRLRSDCYYAAFRLRVELDGRLGHPGGRTDRDTWRDNAVAVGRGVLTLRYRWSHVAVTPCRTAVQVTAALTAQGWDGAPRPCGPSCTATGAHRVSVQQRQA